MMEQWRGQNEVDHFGFDPVSPNTHRKNQSKEQNTTCNHGVCEMQYISNEISTKLSLDEGSPTARHSTARISDSYFKGLELNENNTSTTADFWGFDPPDNTNKKSHASQQGHKDRVAQERAD